jgi:ribonuclease HI
VNVFARTGLTVAEARVLHRALAEFTEAHVDNLALDMVDLLTATRMRESAHDYLTQIASESGALHLWTDGAARPTNPGPAGIGIVGKIGGRTVIEVSEYIGRTTNNVAEYLGAVTALQRAIDIGAKDVILHTDSALVSKQYHGDWQCKVESLQPLLGRLRGLAKRFDSIDIRWIPREKNREADGLSVAGAYAPRPCGACGHDWHFDSFCTAPGDEPGVACACPHGFRGGLEA